jgi:hypothetical protein
MLAITIENNENNGSQMGHTKKKYIKKVFLSPNFCTMANIMPRNLIGLKNPH